MVLAASVLMASCAKPDTEETTTVESTTVSSESVEDTTVGSTEVSFESETEEETTVTATDNVSNEDPSDDPYDIVLNRIVEAAYEEYDFESFDEGFFGSGIEEVIMHSDAEEALSMLYYAFADLDDNGEDELLIMNYNEYYDNYPILAIYAIDNGEAKMFVEGWSRCRYYLLPDKTIYNSGSSGAAYSSWGYYSFDGSGLILTEGFYTDNGSVYRVTDGDSGYSNGEYAGTTSEIPFPEISEYYEFDEITVLSDYCG